VRRIRIRLSQGKLLKGNWQEKTKKRGKTGNGHEKTFLKGKYVYKEMDKENFSKKCTQKS